MRRSATSAPSGRAVLVGTAMVGVSAFLLAFAPLLKFYIAPHLILLPQDYWTKVTMRSDHASYFDAGQLKVVNDAPVVMISTIRGDVRAARKNVAVWDNVTVIEPNGDQNKVLAVEPARFALDRKTGVLVNCCGASVNANTSVKFSGLGLSFPIGGVQKKTYYYYDTTTLQAWPADYQGTERVSGVLTYKFTQTIPETLVEPLPALPAEKFGLPKKQGNLLSDEFYSVNRTMWVDPRTGSILDRREQIREVAKTRDGQGQLVLADFDFTFTPESKKALIAESKSSAAQIAAVRGWGPVAMLVGGLVLLMLGGLIPVVAGSRRGGGGSHAGTPDGDTPGDAMAATAMVPGFRPGAPPLSAPPSS